MMDVCGGVGQQKRSLQIMKMIVSIKDEANETPEEHIKATSLYITECYMGLYKTPSISRTLQKEFDINNIQFLLNCHTKGRIFFICTEKTQLDSGY